MNKKQFIQMAAIQMLPDLNSRTLTPEGAVKRAERLWECLSDAGYGEARESAPSPSAGWYASLEAQDKALFDRFWKAYDLKKDREGAVRAWMAVADRDKLAEVIIAAASIDNAYHRQHKDQARKYAQGWLSGRRWEDYDAKPAQVSANGRNLRAELSMLDSDLKALGAMGANDPASPLYQEFCEKTKIRASVRSELEGEKARK